MPWTKAFRPEILRLVFLPCLFNLFVFSSIFIILMWLPSCLLIIHRNETALFIYRNTLQVVFVLFGKLQKGGFFSLACPFISWDWLNLIVTNFTGYWNYVKLKVCLLFTSNFGSCSDCCHLKTNCSRRSCLFEKRRKLTLSIRLILVQSFVCNPTGLPVSSFCY